MRRAFPVLALLLVVAAAWFLVSRDPFGWFGDATHGRGAGTGDDLREGGPKLEGRGPLAPGADPKEIDGEPVGVLELKLGTATLKGIVTGAGAPLAYARVHPVLPPPNDRLAVRTKKDGRWEIRGLAAGRYDLRASADGWRGRTVVAPQVAEGQSSDVEPIDLQRVPAVEDGIEVRVTDLVGRPIAGAKVLATTMMWGVHVAIGPELAGAPGVVSRTGTTDEDGRVALTSLPPNSYDVVAIAAGFATLSQAQVAASLGRVQKVTFRLAPAAAIAGRVVDTDDKPVANAFVTGLHLPSFANSVTVRSGPDGAFALDGLREGNYMVIAGEDEHGEVLANPVKSPSGGTTLRLGGAGKVVVRVVGTDGKPVTSYRLRPYREEYFGYVYSLSYEVDDPDGRHVLSLSPGVWNLAVQGKDGSFKTDDTAKVAIGETVEATVTLPTTGVVKGVVTDASGNHLAGAEVFVKRGGFPMVPQREQYARSDEEGRFVVKGLPVGQSVKLHAKHAKWAETIVEAAGAPEADAPETTVRLGAGAKVVGHVTDADGRPMANEQVNIYPGGNFFDPRSTRTDESGAYVFEGVMPGKYSVSNGLHENQAAAQTKANVVVGEGGTVTVDFTAAAPKGTRTVVGKVHRGAAPVPNASVSVIDSRGFDHTVSVKTDASGSFEATGVLPGRVTFYVEEGDGGTTTEVVRVPAEGDVPEVDIEVGGAIVTGRVLNPSGGPASGAWLQVETTGEAESVWAKIKASTTTAQDGSFKATGLDPGEYQVRVTQSGQAPLVSAPFSIGEGEAKDLGTLQLKGGVSISGTVKDDAGRPVEDATISMDDASGRPMFIFSIVTTGSDGKYRAPETPPGRYTVKFEARGYAPAHKPVTVEATPISLDAVLTRGGEVRIVVADATGAAVQGARARLLDAQSRTVERTLSLVSLLEGNLGLTNAEGVADVTDLAPGTYRVEVRKDGFVVDGGAPAVQVPPGGRVEVRLTLRPAS